MKPVITKAMKNHLKTFIDGGLVYLCVEPCSQFGSVSVLMDGKLNMSNCPKHGELGQLKAKGLLTVECIFIYGVEYRQYTISELGKKVFMEKHHETV
jgi:hypothetical protein